MFHQEGVGFGQVACVRGQFCFGTVTQFFIAKTCGSRSAAGCDAAGVGVGDKTRLAVTIAEYAVCGFMANTAQGKKLVALWRAGIQSGPRGGQGLEVDGLAGKGACGSQDGCKFQSVGCKDRSRLKQAAFSQGSHGF
jgi:hypothetical protein